MFQFVQNIRNLEGHLNRFVGSKVTAILVNGGILPSGGVALGRVCACSLRSRLVLKIPQEYISYSKYLLSFEKSVQIVCELSFICFFESLLFQRQV